MTPMDIRDAPAGKDINTACTETLGWERYKAPESFLLGGFYVREGEDLWADNEGNVYWPFDLQWSYEIKWAWKLADKLINDGYYLEIYSTVDGEVGIRACKVDSTTKTIASAPTAPLAISRIYLLINGVETLKISPSA